MTQVELTPDLTVTLIDSMGNDDSVTHAARVSIVGARAETEEGERKGLLNFLMSNGHLSPFEHVTATMMLEVPIFVTREIQRHRAFSYNEISARYAKRPPKFYAPQFDRELHQIGKPGKYTFEVGTDDEMLVVWSEMRFAYQTAWDAYERLLENGVAREVARNCLPVGIFTAFYMTGNLRNWMGFLSLRTAPDALFEIREVAFRIEQELYKVAPACMELWDRAGRGL